MTKDVPGWEATKECKDCKAKGGDLHVDGCRWEICPYCGREYGCCKMWECVTGQPIPAPNALRIPVGSYNVCHEGRYDCGWSIDGTYSFPDARRLQSEAIWSPSLRRWVQNQFTEAMYFLEAEGVKTGISFCRSPALGRGIMKGSSGVMMPYNYYAFTTGRGIWRLTQGKDFNLYTGSTDSLPQEELTELVQDTLAYEGIGYKIVDEQKGTFRISAASITGPTGVLDVGHSSRCRLPEPIS